MTDLTFHQSTDGPVTADITSWRGGVEAVGRLLAMVWAFTVLWMVLWSIAPLVIGWTPLTVTSGSMEPAIRTGAVAHIADVDPAQLGVGAIIAFDSDTVDTGRITHRIVGIERDGDTITGYRTKGDANPDVDSDVVPTESVVGAVRLIIPNAAMPAVWQDRGQYLQLGLFVVLTGLAGVATADTLYRFLSRTTRYRLGSRRAGAGAVAVAGVVAVTLPTTSALFTGTTENVGNDFEFAMTSQVYLDTVDADSPIAHWRLDEQPATGPFLFTDDLETFTGWNQFSGGNVKAETTIVRTGSGSLHKDDNNDPNGGWKSLGGSVSGDFVVEAWVYRPTGWSGGASDRFGIENADFDGYSINISHNNNRLTIDRRAGGSRSASVGSPVTLSALPEDEWLRTELRRSGNVVSVEVFDGAGNSLGSASGTDTTTTTFDRFVVHGGHEYYLDDISVTGDASASSNAVDRIGLVDGVYSGNPGLGTAPLIANDPSNDSSVEFDPNDAANDAVLIGDAAPLNLQARDERTLEAWVSVDDTGTRSVIYEEGGSTNGMNLFVEGGELHASAWSRSTNWSTDLVTSEPITVGTTYHVAVVLDAVGSRSLTLYVNGVVVDTATKTDSAQWSPHSDNGAIGIVNGSSRFPDNSTSVSQYFDGRVDEVALYNTALSATRVAAHHAAGI